MSRTPAERFASAPPQQPKYRRWRDMPFYRRVELLLGTAFGATCIAGGVLLGRVTGDDAWSLEELGDTSGPVLVRALVLFGVFVAVGFPAWFFVVAMIMRDVVTGYSTGVIRFGLDAQGRRIAVTHARRGGHECACYCGLLHSDEEAAAAGWRYTGETADREGLGWAGLSSWLQDKDRPGGTA